MERYAPERYLIPPFVSDSPLLGSYIFFCFMFRPFEGSVAYSELLRPIASCHKMLVIDVVKKQVKGKTSKFHKEW